MKLSKFSINKYREVVYKYTLANLNLRAGKSTSENIIDIIPKGTKVEVKFDKPCALQIDGEVVENVTSYTVEVPEK